MSRAKLRDVANDMAGTLLIGTAGTLKTGQLERNGLTPLAQWLVKGKPPVTLTPLPIVGRTLTLVYRDLGVYHGVGQRTPCDWL